jgi:AbrB family looped-hinge helix DNA binding protein
MKRIYGKVTRKGQVTIPAEIRRGMGIKTGDNVAFVVDDGEVKIESAKSWVERTAGIFKGRGPVLTIEQLKEVAEDAWAEEAVERDNRSKRR